MYHFYIQMGNRAYQIQDVFIFMQAKLVESESHNLFPRACATKFSIELLHIYSVFTKLVKHSLAYFVIYNYYNCFITSFL